ncbi:MAG: flagellar biosynthesis anti-sigma factor FlgM [Eubacteriaceae bacterium]
MKIEKFNNNKYINKSAYNKKENEKKKTIEVKQDEKVEISSSAKELVKKISNNEDTLYSEKVEKIRKSIQEGAYKVSPEKIADRIMQVIEKQNNNGEII